MPSTSIAFDRAAGYYDETRGFPPGEAQHVAALIAQVGGLTAASRVLEVGVGTGRIALPLAPHVRALVGIDLAYPMMARLRAKRIDEPVLLVEGDATCLPFAANRFDAAVATHVFHLIPDWREVLRELARVLRPGAPLLHCWNQRSEAFALLREAWNAAIPPQRRAAVGIRRDQYDTFLPDAGWRLVREGAHPYTFSQTPQSFLEQSQKRVYSRTWQLSDDEIMRAAAAVRAAIAAHFGDPDRPVTIAARFHVQAYLPPQAP